MTRPSPSPVTPPCPTCEGRGVYDSHPIPPDKGPAVEFECYACSGTGNASPPPVTDDGLVKITPEELAAWCAFEPAGQFKETMSFARFNGMLKHTFIMGRRSAASDRDVLVGRIEALKDALAECRSAFASQADTNWVQFIDEALSVPLAGEL